MKIEIDKHGRKIYKFSSSAAQGGCLYAHKTKNNSIISNKEGLRNLIKAIAKKYELIDTTIKVYNSIFFLFFMQKPTLIPQKLIEAIQKNISPFGIWHDDYIWTGVYDLQEKYITKDLEKWGYDYGPG